jgi:Skp family chaperone for outer membrane proteins
MNRTLTLVSALGAGLMTVAGMAQAPQPSTQPAPAAAVAPQAIPAKIALIAYEQVAAATNEGQRSIQEIQAKFAPKKAQIDTLSGEVDSLKKQAQSAPSTESDEARASRNRSIDVKEKQLQRDAEDAQTAYNADLQDALGKVAQKLGPTVVKYVQENGYTLLLDISGQQGGVSVMWAAPGTDISQAIITAYNTTSGVAAPVPSAPAPAARTRPTTPRPTTTK